jgi:hypothetical protein
MASSFLLRPLKTCRKTRARLRPAPKIHAFLYVVPLTVRAMLNSIRVKVGIEHEDDPRRKDALRILRDRCSRVAGRGRWRRYAPRLRTLHENSLDVSTQNPRSGPSRRSA